MAIRVYNRVQLRHAAKLQQTTCACSLVFSPKGWSFEKLTEWNSFYISISNTNPNIYIDRELDPFTYETIYHVFFSNESARTAFILKWL